MKLPHNWMEYVIAACFFFAFLGLGVGAFIIAVGSAMQFVGWVGL